ncbi:zinc finger 638-like isoform X1 [Pelobates cultripes]|uniref:Zinc finger 638-like isoform X1 n=1 Tax=Pelobates cultripes TaxID=61616 RepID=A0AAD1SE87_PELCU|nr:zinc finger 638-like isoform X1 [Pelobates cultripes]
MEDEARQKLWISLSVPVKEMLVVTQAYSRVLLDCSKNPADPATDSPAAPEQQPAGRSGQDWIKHQNTPAHIESCRKLRLQYPQWNPQVLSSISDGNKSDDGSTKRWKSHSSSPRRSRGSASRSRARRSRSKSPRSSGRLRSRSRSPRRPRRSPRRSRSPRRRSRSPRRSLSPRRPRHARISRTRSASPDKKAVDAAVANFIESTKAKSGSDKTKSVKTPSNGEKVSPKSASSTARTKKPDSSTSSSKKPSTGSSTITKASSVSSSGSSKKGSSTSSSKRPTSSTTTRKTSTSSSSPKKPSSSSSAVKKPLSTSSSAKKPPRSSSDKNVPAPAQKATPGGKKPFQSKLSAGNKETPAPPRASAQSPVDAFNPLHKFKSKSNSGTIIHVTNLPDFGYTDQDIMKIVQQFGKVSDILIIRSKNEAYLQTNFKEAATAAVKFSETVPVMVNNTRVTLSLAGQKKEPEKVQVKVEVKKPSQKKPPREVIPSGFIKTYKLAEPMFQDTERCVILVSNLPEGQSGVEEISNLAKPFGGVVDIIFVSTHRKAYLQLSNKSSTDSMIKFYDVFPTFISGNAVSIAVNPKFKDLKDEDRIFAEIIEQSPHKIKPSIYENFVHLSNLPEKGYTEFEIVCIGLRFGKVEHYAIFANKKKAILHMCNANAAKAMHSFLSQYPCSIGESLLSCSVPSKTKMEEGEYVMTLEEEKKSSREVESTPVETETTQTADEDSVKGKKCQEKAATSALPETTTATTTSLASTPAAAAPLPIGKEEEKVKPSMTPSPVSGSDEEESTVVKDTTVEQNEQPEESMPIDMEPTKPAEQAFSEQVSDNEMEEQPTHDAELEIIGAEAVTEDEEYGDDDDDDYEEEAAEAPEAPDAEISELIQTESVVSMVNSEADDLPKFPLSEELEVLVSVESEEEEEEEEEEVVVGVMDLGNSKNCQQKQVCPDINMIDDIGVTACEENEDIEGVTVDPEPEDEMGKSSESPKKLGEDAKTEMFEEPKQTVQPVQEQTQKSISVGKCSEVSNVSEPPNSKGNLGKELDSSVTSTESTDQTNKAEVANEKESKSEGDSVSFSTKKNKESKISEETIKESGDLKSSSALRRTAKYNPQKGDISVTLSVDNQRSTSKSDTRKRSSAETRSSGRESSTPKSSSSRSSPAETPGSNPKSSASSQKKNSGKGAPSQQDRDSKATSKSWERETRSSSRKDDWSKNFSQRHQRSSKVSSRGPKSNEGQEKEQFPFDLEEFVTVDEIVEEQSDTQRAKEESKTPQGANGSRKAKRKEHEQSPSEAKKSKGKNTTTHTASKEQSFVTLDEVGDEDDGTPGPESTLTKEAQSLVTVDEVHAEDGQSEDVKVGQELMTLDEISDEEDVNQDTASGLVLTEIPEDLSKEPLLVTLDEVIAEEEETALKSKSPNVENSSLKDAEKKEKKDKSKQSSTKDHPAVDLTEQPLLTLDEVKGDDDVESIADIVGFNEGHQFFTVDEVGEEEEDSSMPSETVTESTVKTDGIKTPEPCENKPDQKSKAIEDSPVVTPRRGRPRKRPLVEKSTPTPADSKSPDSSQKPSAVETPAKQNGKISKAGESPATEKPASADSATPSKKKKVESPSKESPKLGPFNPSTPIGMEFMVPKTGFFCELCSLFYMDDASKLKHCKSLRHYQAIEKHMAKEAELPSKDSKEA